MPVNVYLTLTLFPRLVPNQEMWLTVQPFVTQADLPAWLDGLQPDGSLPDANYQVLIDKFSDYPGSTPQPGDLSKDVVSNMVPVPLPADMSLSIGVRGTGPTADADGYIGRATNDRSGVVILNTPDAVTQFARDNVRTSDRPADAAQLSQRKPPSGAFALTVVTQLSQLWQQTKGNDNDITQAQGMLTMAFLGGTVRRFRAMTVDRQTAVQLFEVFEGVNVNNILPMPVPGADPVKSFSHVSAVGLMFQLDRVASLNALKTLTGIDIWIHPHAAAPNPAATITSAKENSYLAKYFAAFDFSKLKPADQAVTIINDVALSNRAYVTQHLTPFAPVMLTSATNSETLTFRKPASPPSAAAAIDVPPTLGTLDCLLIRPTPRADGDPDDSAIQAATITATLGETLDLRMIPYRSQTPGGGQILMQLIPAPRSRARFVALFSARAAAAPPASTTWLPGDTLYTADGREFVTPDQPGGATAGFVGAYMFAWDDAVHADPATLTTTRDSLPTVLFWLTPPVDTSTTPPSTLSTIPLTLVRAVAAPITATLRGNDKNNPEPLGPRWQWLPPTPGPGVAAPFLDDSVVFNSVAISAAGYTADKLQAALVLAIGVAGDDVFTLAHSASNVEGIITVQYPAIDPNAPVDETQVDPVEQYDLALANYNKLDVGYLTVNALPAPGTPPPSPASVTPLNFWSEALAVYCHDVQANGTWTHQATFHYRYRDPLYAPDTPGDPNPSEEATAARTFFASRFARLGEYRQIVYDLEHTSGDAFTLGANQPRDGGKYLHDLPPTIAADLRQLGTSGAAAAADPFLTWSLAAGTQTVTINVNPEWLAPLDASVTKGKSTSAWLAVAEIAYGQTALGGRFRRFDFAAAAAKAAPGGAPRLSDGLLPVGDYEQKSWPLPAAAIATFKSWLNGTPVAPYSFQVDLGTPGDANFPPLATSCHVVELHLDLTRPASAIPDPAAAWDLKRPVTDIPVTQVFNANGQQVIPAPEAMTGFRQYLATLANGWGTIRPAAPDASIKLTGLLGGPEDSRTDNGTDPTGSAGGEWFAPDIGADVAPGAPITVAMLPLGFTPLAAYFNGFVSAAAVQRHAEALGLMLDTGPGKWQTNYISAQAWRGWFSLLASRQPGILNLLLQAQATVVPAYSTGDVHLDAEVASLVTAAAGDGSGAAAGLRNRIKQAILADPALFGTARAMLLTRLAAPSQLPGDLMRVDMARQLDQADPPVATPVPVPIESVRLPLAAALVAGVTPQQIAFLETLGNAKYDDQFTLKQIAAYGLEELAGSPASAPPATGLTIASTHLPGGVAQPPDNPATGNIVFLPSRQPLVEPIHVWTGSPAAFGDPNWWQICDYGAPAISRSKLLSNGIIDTPTDSTDGMTLRARSDMTAAPMPSQRDVGRVVGVFLVTSDEANGFEDDAFMAQIEAGRFDPNASNAPASPPPPPANLVSFFTELDAATSLAALDDLETAIDPAALALVTSAFSPPQVSLDQARYSISYSPSSPAKLVFAPADSSLHAFLFQPANPAPSPTPHVLIVTYDCDVWLSQRIGMGQTRNVRAQPGQPAFNKSLWQAAPVAGLEKSATARPGVAPAGQSGPVVKGSSGMFDFINRALVDANLLTPEQSPPRYWAARDLSVTINGRLSSRMDTVFPDNAAIVQPGTLDLDHGRMPLNQFKAPAGSLAVPASGTADAICWNSAYASFTADFVWTDEENNEVLRIADLQIVFAP